MTGSVLRRFAQGWNRFFHSPVDPIHVAGLRIGYATLVLVYLGAMFPHVEHLWSENGVLPMSHLRAVGDGVAPTLFAVLPRNLVTVWIAYALFAAHTVALLLGYRSRLSAIAVFVWLVSFQNRNPLALNGQDAVLRLIGFFLLFLPVGRAIAVDARRADNSSHAAWPLRLMQIQIALIMFSAGVWKATGNDWTHGTALYYVTRLEGFWGHLPTPDFVRDSLVASRIGSLLTLSLEIGLPLLIWFERLRRPLLACAVAFHLVLAYSMNLFLFEWIMILGWASFLRLEDVFALKTLLRKRSHLSLVRQTHMPFEGAKER